MKTIGDRIIELRESNNLSRVELAKKLGVNKSSITRFESNEIKPNLDTMIKICETFGISLDWLAGISEQESKQVKRIVKYAELLDTCETNNIPLEKLKKAIDLIK